MEELLDKIKEQFSNFIADAEKQISGAHGARKAGGQSRKTSLEIGRLMKTWRAASVTLPKIGDILSK
jgi:hypothetical protein